MEDNTDLLTGLISSWDPTTSNFDTNAGSNLVAANATTPVITNANGTSTLGSVFSQLFSTALSVAPTVVKAAVAPSTTNALPAQTSTIAGMSVTTLLMIGAAIVAAVLFIPMLLRRRG